MSTITQITPYYPPHLGGMEKAVRELALQQARHHDVTVLTTTIGARWAPRHGWEHAVTTIRTPAVAPGERPGIRRTPWPQPAGVGKPPRR